MYVVIYFAFASYIPCQFIAVNSMETLFVIVNSIIKLFSLSAAS